MTKSHRKKTPPPPPHFVLRLVKAVVQVSDVDQKAFLLEQNLGGSMSHGTVVDESEQRMIDTRKIPSKTHRQR